MSVYYLTAFENFNGTPFPLPTKTTAYFINEHGNIALHLNVTWPRRNQWERVLSEKLFLLYNNAIYF